MSDGIKVIEVSVTQEAPVLEAAFDVLERDGRVTMRALRNALRWNNRRYAELQECYAKWNMSTWGNGDSVTQTVTQTVTQEEDVSRETY